MKRRKIIVFALVALSLSGCDKSLMDLSTDNNEVDAVTCYDDYPDKAAASPVDDSSSSFKMDCVNNIGDPQ